MTFNDMYKLALKYSKEVVLNSKSSYGKVVAIGLSSSNKIYIGYNFKTTCNVGFCAEEAIVSQMLVNGETKLLKLVAVYDGSIIISPCGKCREQLYQLNHENLNCEIMLPSYVTTLEKLLPEL